MSASTGSFGRAFAASKLKLLGVAFLVVLALLFGLTIAIYNKTFVSVVPITLQADRAGNQLTKGADVKLRGILVGEVRDILVTPTGAELKIALQPDQTRLIPSNVEAQLVPKTLFGEKFVDLRIPTQPAKARIAAGDVITQDRSKSAIETSEVFNNLLPLLRTLQPEKLNSTLAAISTALEGRGNTLGENLQLVNSYLLQFNPQIPTLQTDITGTADLAESLNAAAPDLLSFLDNISATNRTVAAKGNDIAAVLKGTREFAITTTRVLNANKDRLIQLGQVSRPVLGLFAEYSPEFPCMVKGLADSEPRLEEAFGGKQGPFLHITLEVVKDQGAYLETDDPRITNGGGPDCHGLPDPRTDPQQIGPPGLDQSNPFDPDADYGVTRQQYGPGNERFKDSSVATGRGMTGALGVGSAGTAQERALVGSLLGPVMGMPSSSVPSIANLLFGPLARGTSVSVGSAS